MLEGLLAGVFFYVVALIIALWCYHLYSPLYQRICWVILLCWVGHYLGSYVYSLINSDSLVQFFNGASPIFIPNGGTTQLVKNVVWYVREYITSDSYLATINFFSAFAFIGSVLWYLLFLQMAQALKISNQKYIFPALVIMCWPSFLFFTSGLVKDSLCYFFTPLILLSWNQFFYERKNKRVMVVIILLSMVLMTMLRPYLLMIFIGAYLFSIFKMRMSLLRVLLLIGLIPVAFYVVSWVGSQGGVQSIDITSVGERAARQQELLNSGSSFPVLSKNPIIVLLTLPYSFIMNLIMPLFIFSNNTMGLLSSLENSALVFLIYRFWKDRQVFKVIKKQANSVTLCFSFFLFGMALLGLLNTNLGLAMRQKSMYVPAFFVVAMLCWLYNKQKSTASICSAPLRIIEASYVR